MYNTIQCTIQYNIQYYTMYNAIQCTIQYNVQYSTMYNTIQCIIPYNVHRNRETVSFDMLITGVWYLFYNIRFTLLTNKTVREKTQDNFIFEIEVTSF